MRHAQAASVNHLLVSLWLYSHDVAQTVTPYCVFAELVSETMCLRSDSWWLEILY